MTFDTMTAAASAGPSRRTSDGPPPSLSPVAGARADAGASAACAARTAGWWSRVAGLGVEDGGTKMTCRYSMISERGRSRRASSIQVAPCLTKMIARTSTKLLFSSICWRVCGASPV